MCGILGILDNKRNINQPLLKRMADRLKHRGPDDEGYYLNPDHSLGLGFRRLSIIDLSTGHQPISNEDRTIWVVLNGEIYNFIELRKELIQKGHKFYTKSDTEVLVHLYEEKGADCIGDLRGMFAFSIWDEKRKRLFLARDRVGKKPLVYCEKNGSFVFASEIKALLEHPDISAGIDFKSLDHYLTYGYSFPGDSIFGGIKKLLPAHYLIFDGQGIQIKRYWNYTYENKLKLKEGEYKELLLDTLSEAVKIRLISDVPLGVLLSGGVDSSCVVALMSKFSNRKIKTFSVGFEDEDYSELKYAKQIAEKFGTEHSEFIVKPDMADILPKLVWHYNEPFGDSSCMPTYYVAKIARQNVTVVLNGDGGDESFAGYERYTAVKFADFLKNFPNCLLETAYAGAGGISRLLGKKETSTFSKIVTYFGILAKYERRYIYPRLISYFSPEEKEVLYTPEFKKRFNFGYAFDFLAKIMEQFKSVDIVDRAMGTDIASYLPEDLLVKMDIATMANSLEGRSPFLDHKVIEMAARIPAGLKLKGITTKYILKKSLEGILPKEILSRKKMGFGMPVGRWFKKDMKGFIESILLSEDFFKSGIFNKNFVSTLLDDHNSGRKNNTHKIWCLLNFELWRQMFIEKKWTYS
ncbi:MAG: asparagine synthase (glutamine-hydrolyzing) [Candidatus Omnitrophica bacterium]|nr:asparagine synthase (glutamine-hydrolyzing) [Candidatus Omnitrophota bacterium]